MHLTATMCLYEGFLSYQQLSFCKAFKHLVLRTAPQTPAVLYHKNIDTYRYIHTSVSTIIEELVGRFEKERQI